MCPGSAASKSVCVMDASGPLGHALVDRLLRRGYTVHAATYYDCCGAQEDDSESTTAPLPCSSDMYKHRLKVFRADPFDYHAIADAVRGCAGVFCIFNTPQDQAECDELMVETEVRAAHNVLEACAQTETMERVVFTSSVTAVVWNDSRHSHLDATAVVDEKSWSDLAFCRKYKLWHALAKTLSEKTAWALAMDRDVDMVAINAGLVTGPGLTAAHPYLKGAPDMYDDGVLVTVDVDFLADAHVAAYESPTAYGRYLCFNNTVCRPEDAVKLAQMLSPSSPRSPPSDELKVIPQRIQNKKLSKLMVEFANGIYGELD
ncbi:cinnamoyl-CoA reductase-like SNL6 [Phragmites australis]|uniref:cinnamoyl-CoA reductase-like SNL6 n=1 Tax=Phragmites australis TaxID=29695 RepID=UPI002D778339|nr:cinnamoyl-CoA reductase-like SNL6 [Phragmites australis]